jgi:acetylornithine deacetylase
VAALRAEIEATVRAHAPAAQLTWPLDNPPFATRAPAAFVDLLGERAERPIDLAFWTEAAVLSAAGVDAVVFGPGDIARAHAADEWVPRADLELARDLFARAFRTTHGTR